MATNKKKFTDEELMALIDKGVEQKDAARILGASPSAVCQRMAKIRAQQPPESFDKLTDKQQRFVLARCEGKSQTESAMQAYDCSDRESAKAIGHRLSKEPDVAVAMADLMAQEGIPRRRRVQKLKDMIECKDLSVVGKGLDMGFKLAGDYAPVQVEVDVDAQLRALAVMIDATPRPASN